MASWELDYSQMEKMMAAVTKFSDGAEAEKIINDYLANEGGDLLKQSIQTLLPRSGRSWTGKKAAASSTDPFRKTPGNLNVKIHTKSAYNYLYFPDDGENTRKHFGNQQFMLRGGQNKSAELGENIINKLIQKLED